MLFDALLIVIFICLLFLISPLLARYIANLFSEETPLLSPALGWLENLCYKVGGLKKESEMTWKAYAKALLIFNVMGFIFVFILQLAQGHLPLNPEQFNAVPAILALNTAASFSTNTNWQAYAGETSMSYLTQMLGLTSQNFLSASSGLSAMMVLIRGILRRESDTVGNFWRDLIRSCIYLLLPLSFFLAFFLISQGTIQSFSPYIKTIGLEKQEQIIPRGPVASQVAIKQLGSNGGGFFNANSAHPFENPTPLSNFFQMFSILLIPASSVLAYGKMVGSKKEGKILFIVMSLFLVTSASLAIFAEISTNPIHSPYPNWEGKETRIGIIPSVFWAISTTATSNGSTDAMISSLSPLAHGLALFNIKLGEIIFGGVGVGLCSMLMFVFLTVFLSGLMVGKTPEYLGKKIEKKEMQWVMLAVLVPGMISLIGSGIASITTAGISSVSNLGPHGLTEILYAFSSSSFNNGSAFSGLNANTPFYNLFLGFCMILGRLSIILPSLAIGGLLAKKKITPKSMGTLSTSSFIFAVMLICTILIVGGLTFFPALSIGPILEHYLLKQQKIF